MLGLICFFAAITQIFAAQELRFTQELDHFNRQDQRTWQQRYFLNDTMYNNNTGGPMFVMLGGEGAISAAYVQVLQMSVFAAEQHALQVALEHRFYGASVPLGNLSTANLAFLSIEQALADAATFVAYVRKQYPLVRRVIVFGGSYSGALASWFRLKYPHLVDAAVASSAPVHIVLDMLQYLAVVDKSLDTITGPACDARIRAATTALAALMQTADGRLSVKEKFRLCWPLNTTKDDMNFLSNVMGNWMEAVQYNDEGVAPNAIDLCKMIMNTSMSALDAYAAVSNFFLDKGACMDGSYNNMIQLLTSTDATAAGVGMRQWTYQTCTQMAFYQTTDASRQPFGRGVPLAFYRDICQDVFGFTFAPSVDETNVDYGSKAPAVSNVLYVNGDIDPWHALSVLRSTQTYRALLIHGTAHCDDMMPSRQTDSAELRAARSQISAQIAAWLQ